jgi:hypothetical protein
VTASAKPCPFSATCFDHSIFELARKNGEVVDRAEAEAAIFARARQERDAWLAFSSRAAAVLAAEAGVDPGRSFPVLDRIVREHLAELAATPLKLNLREHYRY